MTNAAPRLTIGLPVYNGQEFLPDALDSLLAQTYTDFELIISDNASTDHTEEICRRREATDPRIRYLRQPRNIGAAPNHNVVVREARGELFKWASHDDLYGRDLLARCVETLDAHPDAVLASCWSAIIDGAGAVLRQVDRYPPATDSPRAAERFKGVLFGHGGDDDYGVIRTDVLRRTPLGGSHYHADRTLVAELALHGRFIRIPERHYLRREHPHRVTGAGQSIRGACVTHDPRRADRLRHPTARLLAEFVWSLVDAIRRAPLPATEKRSCYRVLAGYLSSRAFTPPARRDGLIPNVAPPVVTADAPPGNPVQERGR